MLKNDRLESSLIQRDVLLAPMTTWRVGGIADYFAVPKDEHQLSQVVLEAQGIPVTWLGLGSNVLIRDRGIRGLVLSTRGLLEINLESSLVTVGSGVPCAKLARFCQKQGLGGGEFFVGIPGTLGGALAMNAGAFGGTTWPHVQTVTVIDQTGRLLEKTPLDFEIGYRSVKPLFDGFLGFVRASLLFKSCSSEAGKCAIRDCLKKRQAKQPIGTFNCGSVYQNPAGQHAAALIEACGLKGKQVGGAIVSIKHANFIINQGDACSKDIELLMNEIELAVFERFGIKLEREVKILGESF